MPPQGRLSGEKKRTERLSNAGSPFYKTDLEHKKIEPFNFMNRSIF